MKILLLAPPWGSLYGNYKAAAKLGFPYPPLGLCYLGSHLLKDGHDVKIIDCETEAVRLDDLKEVLSSYKPDLVGIQVLSPLVDVVKQLCDEVKSISPSPIVLGGPHVSAVKEEVFAHIPNADYAIINEAEFTICQLVHALEKKIPFQEVANLYYKEEEKILFTKPLGFLENLDEFLPPARHLVQNHLYNFIVPKVGLSRTSTVLTSRGCPFNCTFCFEPMMFGRRARFRDPIKVVDEIEETHKKYGIKHFVFLDDTLTLRKENIYQLCDELIRRDLDITWEGWTHANTMTEELALKMRKAGLVRLSFGIESGDPEVLKKLRKGTTVERLRAAYRCAKAAGVETRGSVILGLPGDTKESVERTIKFVTSLKDLDHCYFNIASPYPGTEMRNLALNSMEGIRLLSKEYSLLKRQGQSVVMEVNDLDTKTLISLQNKAYLRFWLRPRRILYNIKRQNFVSTIKNGLVFYNSFISPMLKKSKYPFRSEISAIQSLNLKNRDQIAE